MNTYYKIVGIGFVMMLCSLAIEAQTHNLTSDEQEIFRTEVKNRVNRFQMYLTFIGSKKNDRNTKAAYVKETLKLFIGQGEKYTDTYGNVQPAVRMQLSDVKSGRKYWRETKTYLNNLIGLPYQKLEITAMDTCRVGEFYKVRDGLYMTTVYIKQRFDASTDSRHIVNYDEKCISVYLKEEITSVGGIYRVLFGDIEVKQSTQL